MTHWSKLSRLFVISTFLLVGTGYSAAVKEEITEVTIKERIQNARTLNELYDLASKEQKIRLRTWGKMKGGEDKEALERSVNSLLELKNWVSGNCMELTGLKQEERDGRIRVRQHFFEDCSKEYKAFSDQLVELLARKAGDGSLSVPAGKLYGELIGEAGQRSIFYKEAFGTITGDAEMFTKEGLGSALSALTMGYASSLEATFGKYFYAKNSALVLLMVPKEEVEAANQIVSLLENFHEPLDVKVEPKVSYMASFSEDFLEKRDLLAGNLSLSQVRAYMENKDFWAGSILELTELSKHESAPIVGVSALPEGPLSVSEEDSQSASSEEDEAVVPQEASLEIKEKEAGQPPLAPQETRQEAVKDEEESKDLAQLPLISVSSEGAEQVANPANAASSSDSQDRADEVPLTSSPFNFVPQELNAAGVNILVKDVNYYLGQKKSGSKKKNKAWN